MTETTAKEGSTSDWLGYGAYADALWGRIQTALIKSERGNAVLGDDPLVIGVFGEWGAGKSKLLSLMQDRSRAWASERIGWRKRDGGNFGLTVPVYFQPWKYEHEQHLHVPLLLHIFSALKQELLAAQTWGEWAGGKVPHDITKHMEAVVSQFGKLLASAAVAMDLTLPLASRAGLMAAGFLAKMLPGFRSKPLGSNPSETLKHTDSGRYFYEIHEALKAVTRPKQHGKYLQGVNISKDLPINFVIFIDDLDRCLPEKAVQTLELIKTIFNAESFAFVLALDDEVIERGIGHRYKDYQLVGKKPEMPITGFEYLEKIIHLPFRLPALTREQAGAFVRKYESDIEPDATLRWFKTSKEADEDINNRLREPGQPSPGRAVQPTDLLELALSGFDAFMPRKLIRLVELLHQVAAIARLRQKPLQLTYGGELDVRVVLVLLLIQLFQPELFRVMRRRDESFPALLAAFSVRPIADSNGQPESPDLPSAQMADIDLWCWAVDRKYASVEWSPEPSDSLHNYAVNRIAKTYQADDRTNRTSAQQVRLPIVVQVIEHRAAQRHVFDVLKLTKRLAEDMTKTGSSPHRLTFAPYLSFLAQGISQDISPPLFENQSKVPSPQVGGSRSLPTFSLSNVEDLAQLLVSTETEAQANMASRLGLRQSHVLDQRSGSDLVAKLSVMLNENQSEKFQKSYRLLNSLRYLTPFLTPEQGRALWELVKDRVNFNEPINPRLRGLRGDVRYALGCDDRFDPQNFYLLKDRFPGHSVADEPLPGFVRIPAGTFPSGGKDEIDAGLPASLRIEKPFFISRTLVTVDQYAVFILDGGYADSSPWWDKQGIDWRNGWIDIHGVSGAYKDHLVRPTVELRNRPMRWDEQKALGSHPVWAVNWFEARAYARWLNAKLASRILSSGLGGGYSVMLPTELQWERAARAASLTHADTRTWPWGREEVHAEQHANLAQAVGNVCAVGLFPPNPIGLYDMAGNVWEWMDNLIRGDTSSFARVERDRLWASGETFDSSVQSSLRGGSWSAHPAVARCSLRVRYGSSDWDDYMGLRVVLSQPD